MSFDTGTQHGTAGYWSGHYAKGGDWQRLTEQERQLLASLPRRPGDIALDLACGTGELAHYLDQLGYQTIGVDFAEAAVMHAQRQGHSPGDNSSGPRFMCADFTRGLPGIESGSVALVTCRLAVPFVDRSALLDQVMRWLRTDGRFVVTVPSPDTLNPSRRRISLSEEELAGLGHGWARAERHRADRLSVLILSGPIASHGVAERKKPNANALVGIAVVVQDPDSGRVLVGRSAQFPDMFECPGGRPEPGEELRKAAARQLEEQTGLLVDPADMVLTAMLVDERGQLPRVTVVARASGFTGTPQPRKPQVVASWDWYEPQGIPGPLFKPSRDALAACFPEHIFGESPARRYPLATGRRAVAHLSAHKDQALSPAECEPSRVPACVWTSATALFTDPFGRVLLLVPARRELLAAPGGTVERGEYPDAALSRVVRVTTGLQRSFSRLLAKDTVPYDTTDTGLDPAGGLPGVEHTVWDGGVLTAHQVQSLVTSAEFSGVRLVEPGELHEHTASDEARRLLAAVRARIDHTTAVLNNGFPVTLRALDRHGVLRTPRPDRAARSWHWGEDVPEELSVHQVGAWCFRDDGRVLVLAEPDSGLVSLPGGVLQPGETPEAALRRTIAAHAKVRIKKAVVDLGYMLDRVDPQHPTVCQRYAARITTVLPDRVTLAGGQAMVRLWASPAQASDLMGWGPDDNTQAEAAQQVGREDFELPQPLPSPVTEVAAAGELV